MRRAGEPAALLDDGLPLDDFLPYLMNRIAHRLNLDLNEELRTIGTTLPQWRVLAVLKVGDGRNVGELSVYTVIEQSTLSRILERMAEAGFVDRRSSARDARVTEVFLTSLGAEMFEKSLPIALRHFHRATHGLGEAEVARLVRTLHKVLDNVRRSPYP